MGLYFVNDLKYDRRRKNPAMDGRQDRAGSARASGAAAKATGTRRQMMGTKMKNDVELQERNVPGIAGRNRWSATKVKGVEQFLGSFDDLEDAGGEGASDATARTQAATARRFHHCGGIIVPSRLGFAQ